MGNLITIHVLRRQEGEKDRKGLPKIVYGDPEPIRVLGVAPRSREEPQEPGRPWAVETVWDIYGPLGIEISPYDRVVLPTGQTCEVVGEVAVWDHNPHSTVALQGGVHFTVQATKG